jgi:hypothetical protein
MLLAHTTRIRFFEVTMALAGVTVAIGLLVVL